MNSENKTSVQCSVSSVRSAKLSPEDQERIDFLKRLDNAQAVEVTDWEAGFIESFLTGPRPMTRAQGAAVDAMRDQYEASL